MGTGNNCTITNDMVRRTCAIDLLTNLERPDLRDTFTHPNLLNWIKDNRRELVMAALSIPAAYIMADKPTVKMKPWAKCEGWDSLVRASLIWAGLPDPDTRETLAAQADDDTALLRQLMAGWDELDGAATVGEAVRQAGLGGCPTLLAVLSELPGNDHNRVSARRCAIAGARSGTGNLSALIARYLSGTLLPWRKSHNRRARPSPSLAVGGHVTVTASDTSGNYIRGGFAGVGGAAEFLSATSPFSTTPLANHGHNKQDHTMNITHAAKYKLSAAEREKKLRKFTDVSDPEDLRGELACARLLAQESLEQGNIGTANLILNTIGKLAHSHVAVKRMKSEYLERAVVLRLAVEIVRILSESVEGKFPGWETAMSDAGDKVGAAIAAATNNNTPRLENHSHA